MNEIQIFKNADFGEVRTTEANNAVWFCASDVTRALGYSNGRDAVAKHVDTPDVAKYDIGVTTGTKADGTPAIQIVPTTFINESGVYALIFGSKKSLNGGLQARFSPQSARLARMRCRKTTCPR